MKQFILITFALFFFTGCGKEEFSQPVASMMQSDLVVSAEPPAIASDPVDFPETPDNSTPPIIQAEARPSSNIYLNDLIGQIIEKLAISEASEYERAKAAFDYMIEYTILDDPIGLELWRVHGGGDAPIPFVEQRALSPLRFGVGMCEDYAAALTLLLRGMGLEAEYVPGLTYSLEGHLVDHAWTVVKIDGVWYHLDCQLEDNISKRGTVRYRYFLKGDSQMAGSHLWGQRLIDSGLLTAEQNAELAAGYLAPDCPQDYPTPEPHLLADAVAPDLDVLRAEAQEEIAAYEAEHGALPAMELNTTPPVFGLDGFGPADEG